MVIDICLAFPSKKNSENYDVTFSKKNQPLADVVKHVEVGYKMEAPDGCPTEIYEMMRQAWDLNPLRRPTFQELKVKLLQLKLSTT